MAKKLAFDKVLFTSVVLLVGLGLVMVYSASAANARSQSSVVNPFLVRQSLAAALGLVGMGVAMHVDYQILRRPAVIYTLLAGAVVLLVAVLFAPQLNRTHRWLFVGGVSVQASELAKLAMIPYLAYQIEKKWGRIDSPSFLLPSGCVVGMMAGLILLEPDLGTTVVLLAVAGMMLFLAGLAWRLLLLGGLALAPALWFLVISVPYRRERFLAFLAPEQDPLGTGFQVLQSLIAVGSGGLTGLGPGKSVQKLHFLPYADSDFIFSIVAEELGLIGSAGVLLLFVILLWRGVRAGLKAPDILGRFLAWGFCGLLFLQVLINVSVALALLPTTGTPLPFISYGGSSLVTSMTACGVVLNVSQHG